MRRASYQSMKLYGPEWSAAVVIRPRFLAISILSTTVAGSSLKYPPPGARCRPMRDCRMFPESPFLVIAVERSRS